MRTTLQLLFLLAATVCSGAQASEPDGLSESLTNPGYHEQPSWFKLSFLDMREDVREATAANKRVLLYFYQDGCPYCKKLLEDNFGQREIAEKTRKHFDVIAINMWGDKEVVGFDGQQTTEKKFAARLRVMFTPTLLFLDEKGNVVLRVNGYYFPAKFNAALDFVANKMEAKTSFRDYYAKVAPVPAQGKLHEEPYMLKPPYDLTSKARENSKPLLVLFEQKQCKPCDELHSDILKRRESRKQLDKFDVVLLDRWSKTPVVTPLGTTTTAAQWAVDLDIEYAPSLVFFDTSGNEVFRTEAYLKAFHIQGAMAYVDSGAYRKQPNFQRFLQGRREELENQGVKVDLME
jgi:thioredoxin-related protein